MTDADGDEWAPEAAAQFDAINVGPDPDLARATYEACDVVLNDPDRARLHSASPITSDGQVCFVLPITGSQKRVYWPLDPHRIRLIT